MTDKGNIGQCPVCTGGASKQHFYVIPLHIFCESSRGPKIIHELFTIDGHEMYISE